VGSFAALSEKTCRSASDPKEVLGVNADLLPHEVPS
jgi:hypothetical protein